MVHSGKDESKRSRHRRDNDRDRERQSDRHRDREKRDHRQSRRWSDHEKSVDDDEYVKEKHHYRDRERHNDRRKRGREDDDDGQEDSIVEDVRKRHRRDYYYDDSYHYSERRKRHSDDGSSEGSPGGIIRTVVDIDCDKNEKETTATTREEDECLEEEEEGFRLDEEIEKRRRRVQEWQQLKRKREEFDALAPIKSGKAWTLDGESDDEEIPIPIPVPVPVPVLSTEESEEDMIMAVDFVNETAPAPTLKNEGNVLSVGDEEEIDPLDAFMNSIVLPQVEKLNNTEVPLTSGGKKMDSENKDKIDDRIRNNWEQPRKGSSNFIGRIILSEEDSDSDYGESDEEDTTTVEDENDDDFMKRVKKTKAEKLSIVDHSKIDYQPFQKNFYFEVKEISRMTSEEVVAYRKELEIKLHGKDVPKPIKTWHQTGLSSKTLDTIKKLNYSKPMAIQAQGLPIIMSGRDCIGVAKTGSGKTLAFVLPMLRHIKAQPPIVSGDGPIGLIMAPTRELVQQIHSDLKKFSKVMGVRCVPVYGGSNVAQQISELKRGAEIVVCTPGRMIDILCTSGGKITNLRRVTFFVMDEADRMFDMGFEPQITRIIQNTRPDRQTVLFSATFPRQVEILARKVLNKPIEIQVGGRNVVNKDIAQFVEVRPENERFLRLLELLGKWSEKGKILIFVRSQEKCDSLFKDLLKHGYPCLSLHGAKDQSDRESTISDFKSNVCNLLIATSIAARGLDVKELRLVINFDVPNHYEDYVHRVGRTGRAGQNGCAITFISEEDARYAPDLVKALELCEQVVPGDLNALADSFVAKVNQGLEQAHGTGYGGSGFKFNEKEDEVRKAAKKAQAKEYGFEEDKSDSEDEDDGVRKAGGDISQQASLAKIAALAAASKAGSASMTTPVSTAQLLPNGGLLHRIGLPTAPNDWAAQAVALAAAMNLQRNLAKIQADAMPERYVAELEINDFPHNARCKMTEKETLGSISEGTGAAITIRGEFYKQGRTPGLGERKLYLSIEGPTEHSVKRAKAELKRVLEDITCIKSSGRYSLV